MRHTLIWILGVLVALCAQIAAQAQAVAVGGSGPRQTEVPFIGCKSDGQAGFMEAPDGVRTVVSVSPTEAEHLGYYRSAQGVGVLAPRGWHCFGVYGSSGDTLLVAPQTIDVANLFSPGRTRFSGPVIQLSRRSGDTSGRMAVAEVIAQVFPSHRAFVTQVMEGFELPETEFHFGPHPTDTLTYKGETVIEYRTPAQTEGLGTLSWWLEKSDSPIHGAAILVGDTPDLWHLSVRLPAELAEFTPAILRQLESEASHARD